MQGWCRRVCMRILRSWGVDSAPRQPCLRSRRGAAVQRNVEAGGRVRPTPGRAAPADALALDPDGPAWYKGAGCAASLVT